MGEFKELSSDEAASLDPHYAVRLLTHFKRKEIKRAHNVAIVNQPIAEAVSLSQSGHVSRLEVWTIGKFGLMTFPLVRAVDVMRRLATNFWQAGAHNVMYKSS